MKILKELKQKLNSVKLEFVYFQRVILFFVHSIIVNFFKQIFASFHLGRLFNYLTHYLMKSDNELSVSKDALLYEKESLMKTIL